MKAKLFCAIACVALSPATFAAEPDQPTYRDRFATCAHESKGLKGDEHQKFMSDCLKGHGSADKKDGEPHKTTAAAGEQQNRMRSCNEEAHTKNLHGDERRSFMSTCLKG
jgi:hypothetical protein